MAGYMKNLGNGKFQLEVSHGKDEKGKRQKSYKTITVTGKTEQTMINKAEKELALFVAEVEKGEYKKPTHLTFSEYSEQWKKSAKRRVENKDMAPKTFYRYTELLRLHIIPGIGNMKIEDITALKIESFYDDLREKPIIKEQKLKNGTIKKTSYKLSESTIKYVHIVINVILGKAFKANLIKENPCERVDKPTHVKPESKCYDQEDIYNLIDCLENAELKFKTIIHIALSGGLRLGEIMGLEWSDIDFENNIIDVNKSSQYLPGQGIFDKLPKNKSSIRKVGVPKDVIELIEKLRIERNETKLLLGTKWKDSNKLFTTIEGEPMHPTTATHFFKKFLEKNNLPPMPFHGLRHTSASYLISQGYDVITVSKRLGHNNPNTTQGIYSHLFKKREIAAAEAMDGLYSKKKTLDKAN